MGPARADIRIIMEKRVYAFPISLVGFSTTMNPQQKFLSAKRNMKSTPYVTHILGEVVSPPKFEYLKSPRNSVIPPAPEGCGEHPMKWIAQSKVIAQLKASNETENFYFETPEGATNSVIDASFKNFLKKDLDAGVAPEFFQACLANSKAFRKNNEAFVYTACGGELNEELSIFRRNGKGAWKLEAKFTLTDNCP
jgi:hypothetical protein